MIRITLPWSILASENERNTRRGGKAHSVKYKDSLELIYWQATAQVKERPAYAEGPVEVSLRFFPPSWRPDCHNMLKGLLDSLQGVAYTNDRQLRSMSHLVVDVDRDNPRVEITIARWLSTEAA